MMADRWVHLPFFTAASFNARGLWWYIFILNWSWTPAFFIRDIDRAKCILQFQAVALCALNLFGMRRGNLHTVYRIIESRNKRGRRSRGRFHWFPSTSTANRRARDIYFHRRADSICVPSLAARPSWLIPVAWVFLQVPSLLFLYDCISMRPTR